MHFRFIAFRMALPRERAAVSSNFVTLLWVLTSGIALIVFWLINTKLLQIRGPFVGDEGVHALKGVQFAYDLKTGDWLGFMLDSYRQVLYPPLHSWVVAIAYLVAGPSINLPAAWGCSVLWQWLPFSFGLGLICMKNMALSVAS
jgi:hypothetical protein